MAVDAPAFGMVILFRTEVDAMVQTTISIRSAATGPVLQRLPRLQSELSLSDTQFPGSAPAAPIRKNGRRFTSVGAANRVVAWINGSAWRLLGMTGQEFTWASYAGEYTGPAVIALDPPIVPGRGDLPWGPHSAGVVA